MPTWTSRTLRKHRFLHRSILSAQDRLRAPESSRRGHVDAMREPAWNSEQGAWDGRPRRGPLRSRPRELGETRVELATYIEQRHPRGSSGAVDVGGLPRSIESTTSRRRDRLRSSKDPGPVHSAHAGCFYRAHRAGSSSRAQPIPSRQRPGSRETSALGPRDGRPLAPAHARSG